VNTTANVYFIVPVKVPGDELAEAARIQRCQYFAPDWTRVDSKQMRTDSAGQVQLVQPTQQDAEPHVQAPDVYDPEAVLLAATAKTLRETRNLPYTYVATRQGAQELLTIQLEVASSTRRGVILVFTKPGEGANVERIAATADPEITNSTNK
jgi:hypothetical protein